MGTDVQVGLVVEHPGGLALGSDVVGHASCTPGARASWWLHMRGKRLCREVYVKLHGGGVQCEAEDCRPWELLGEAWSAV